VLLNYIVFIIRYYLFKLPIDTVCIGKTKMDSRQLDKQYWDNRYKKQQTGWDIGYASPAIVNYVEQSIPKTASVLIPGCGNAHEAKALLAKGYQHLTLLDIAPSLVKKVRQEFKENTTIQIICQDFFQFDRQYDYILEQTFFCALDPSLRKDYVRQMHKLLSPHGRLAGLLFQREFSQPGPPFGGSKREYHELFQSHFDILHLEECPISIPSRQGNELFFELKKK
jgi:SAM-dependent methyltransferase